MPSIVFSGSWKDANIWVVGTKTSVHCTVLGNHKVRKDSESQPESMSDYGRNAYEQSYCS